MARLQRQGRNQTPTGIWTNRFYSRHCSIVLKVTVFAVLVVFNLFHAVNVHHRHKNRHAFPDIDDSIAPLFVESFKYTSRQKQDAVLYSSLSFPQGVATPLPALGLAETETNETSASMIEAARLSQGLLDARGLGEPKHLGGYQFYDDAVLSPAVFESMVTMMNIRSVLDLGCGRGWLDSWFHHHNVSAVCVEASRDAIRRSVIENEDMIVAHDFTRGPWWPESTVDAAWIGFVPQVSAQFQYNYLAAASKAAFIFMTLDVGDDWHLVERHAPSYWISRFRRTGFVFEEDLTNELRMIAKKEAEQHQHGPGGMYNATSIQNSLLVFSNPRVTGLPDHMHLLNEVGCTNGCDPIYATKLEETFVSKTLESSSQVAWEAMVAKQLDRDRKGYIGRTGEYQLRSEHAVEKIPGAMEQDDDTEDLPVIHVLLWPQFEHDEYTAESVQIEKDGILESLYLDLTEDGDNFENIVWILDSGYAFEHNISIEEFISHMDLARKKRAKLGLPVNWPIYVVNWSDGWIPERYYVIEQVMGPDMVRYFERDFVVFREWSNDWVSLGQRKDDFEEEHGGDCIFGHTPLTVRTDTVASLKAVLSQRGLDLAYPIESLPRPVDVTHLWPLDGSTGISEEKYSKLRTRVSEIVADMGATEEGMNVFVGLAGSASHAGRNTVHEDYIHAMLDTKILVVTQRDEWEDHYRLMEALVAGSCVFTDRMLALPEGLEDGVVQFESELELREKILYYLVHEEERLEIAREGRRVAMSKHRSWHRMEQIIFGSELTTCEDDDDESSTCPYIVHASEI